MWFIIAFILLAVWIVGLVSAWAIGAFVHLLLIAAIVLFMIGFLRRGQTAA